MDTLDRIYDMMYCELDEIAKKEKLDSKDVELIDKFVDIIKDIEEINMSQDMGYSQMGGSSYMRGRSGRGMYNNSGRMYNRGSSYMRNGNGYSRDDNKDMMLEHLQSVADMAVDEKDRKAIERLMSQMDQQR